MSCVPTFGQRMMGTTPSVTSAEKTPSTTADTLASICVSCAVHEGTVNRHGRSNERLLLAHDDDIELRKSQVSSRYFQATTNMGSFI